MTLLRQIFLMVAGLFVLMFVGTFAISLNNTRDYLVAQLESHAQDTATSLGLSLSPHVAAKDPATVQSMVDAIFDRGYYRLIRVSDIQGRTLYERGTPVRIETVPQWFIRLIPLEAPSADALLMAGWNQAGSLEVASHPGYAYDELWRNASGTLLWFAGSAALALLLAYLALRGLLRPLRAVERQAEAICNREYPIQDRLPWTRELRAVVQAMNRMSARLAQQFREQAELTEHLQREVYVDPVTGLGNRRHFERHMTHLLDAPEEFSQGALFLLQLNDFKGFNDRHGYQAGDDWLRGAARVIHESALGQVPLAARLGGADFAFLVPGLNRVDAEGLARRLFDGLAAQSADGRADIGDLAQLGVVLCRGGERFSDCIARADLALRAAQHQGPNQCHIMDGGPVGAAPLGAEKWGAEKWGAEKWGAAQWKERLLKHLGGDSMLLHVQPVVASTALPELMHYEVLLRIRGEDGSLMAAGTFIPMAARLGLAQALDRRAVELAAGYLAATRSFPVPAAVNLAPASVCDPRFQDWLRVFLGQCPDAARLVFEVPEHSVPRNIEMIRAFSARLEHSGAGLAIDHFGRGFSSFAYLRTLRIRYLKVDGGYTRGIEANTDNQFFVRALTTTAHELDLQVIAESVETDAERETLCTLNIDGLQGYLIGRPAPPPA